MHLRLVNAKSGATMRRYAQLVESYRRDDGVPAHRVVANLGQLSDQEVQNLRVALAASRNQKSLVLPESPKWQARVLANLAYLDVAVALELWRSWELSELLKRLIPERKVAVRAAEIICALVIQRCVSPGSKLYAGRWFPRTALPELLGVAPAQFHNTRIHRVLDQLDRVDSELQDGLIRRYRQRDGAFVTLFTDTTDAWFEGRGPDFAERGRTKEGLRNRYKIGILLLCNERGYPLRWTTLPGRMQDGKALRKLVADIEEQRWAQGVPIAFDRAMGSAGAVARLCSSKLHFLTAIRRSEYFSYIDQLPSDGLAELQGSSDEAQRKQRIAAAAECVVAAGMEKVDDELFVLDLGIVSREFELTEDAELTEQDIDTGKLQGGALWLHRAREYRTKLDAKVCLTQSEIAKTLGVTRARMTQVMHLLGLDETLQKEVISGGYGLISDRSLRGIAQLRGKDVQRRALVEYAATHSPQQAIPKPKGFQRTTKFTANLRVIAYFNPQMLVDQRTIGERQRRQLEDFVRDLNIRLAHTNRERPADAVYAEVTGKLAALSLLSVYTPRVDRASDAESKHWVVSLDFNEAAWKKRRSTDGFILLVAHRELPQNAAEMVALYRAKDAVEKDFQTIKSDLELRPIFHHTDPKVRAHVSLCMLALLLERTLEHKLREAGMPMTAPACFEELAGGHLNMVATTPDEPAAYLATEPNADQQALLSALRFTQLLHRDEMADRIEPRPAA